jgi:CBS domain-containing protein
MDIRTVMTPDPIVCDPSTSLQEVARIMRDEHIGDVIVGDESGPCGIVTDRDIVVRALADQSNVSGTTVGDVCTGELRSVDVDASIDELISLMEEHSLRRVPVVNGGAAIGIVSIGDLAERLDPRSLLGEISASPPDKA